VGLTASKPEAHRAKVFIDEEGFPLHPTGAKESAQDPVVSDDQMNQTISPRRFSSSLPMKNFRIRSNHERVWQQMQARYSIFKDCSHRHRSTSWFVDSQPFAENSLTDHRHLEANAPWVKGNPVWRQAWFYRRRGNAVKNGGQARKDASEAGRGTGEKSTKSAKGRRVLG